MDTSIQVFYDELLDKILQDPFDNSYAEFNYEFKQRNKLFNAVQRYIQKDGEPFYNSFTVQNALYNIKIKELKFIECYSKSVPAKGGKYLERFVVKFTVLFEK
jgi:hypothetical protein